MDITVMILQPYQLQEAEALFRRAGVSELLTYTPQPVSASALNTIISAETKWQCVAVIPSGTKIDALILFSPEASTLIGGHPFRIDQIVIDPDFDDETTSLIQKYLSEFARNLLMQ